MEGGRLNMNSCTVFLAESSGRIFGLDAQLIFDAIVFMCAMFVLFTILTYLLFKPARELLNKRQEKIDGDLQSAESEKNKAEKLKEKYDAKLKQADKESEQILSETRKKALERENKIIEDAKQEATKIIERANKEAELEKSKMKDDVKKEMISVASIMAGKFVAESIDEKKQESLIDETLKEMGDSTWQS